MREFARSHDRVTAQVAELQNNPRLATQVRRLEEMERSIRREMEGLASIAQEHAPGVVNELAESGFKTGAKQAGAGVVTDFSMINRPAVEQFASGLTDDLLKATNGVVDSTRDLVRATARDQGLRSMIEGATAQDAGRAMRDHLHANGIFAVRYSDGSRHNLGDYSQMVMRTTTAQAYNTSLVDGAQSEGTEFFEIFDGPDCGLEFHDDSELAAGLIVSGSTATSFPIAHPNCRRAFGARPDIKTQAEADAGTPHVTQEQMEAQRAADDAARGQASQRSRQERREGNRTRERGTQRAHSTREDRIEQYRRRTQRGAPPPPGGRREVSESLTGYKPLSDYRLQGRHDIRANADELDALFNYTQPYTHHEINNPLRTGQGPAHPLTEHLDSITTNNRMDEGVNLYRGIDHPEMRQQLLDAPPGTRIIDRGFTSASANKEITEDFMFGDDGILMEIRTPPTTRGVYIGNKLEDHSMFFNDQQEFLFARGTEFSVVSKKTDAEGILHVVMDVISQGNA